MLASDVGMSLGGSGEEVIVGVEEELGSFLPVALVVHIIFTVQLN